MQVSDYAGAVAAVRIVRTPGCDLGLERAGIALGVFIGSRGGVLRGKRTQPQKERRRESKNEWASHRELSLFAVSLAVTTADVASDKGNVVWSPAQ